MKITKKQIKILFWILIIGIILTVITSKYDLLPFTVGTGFTPIYCNDYSFTCCVEEVGIEQEISVAQDEWVRCPLTATKCEARLLWHDNPNIWYYRGKSGCHAEDPWYASPYWTCSDESLVQNFNTQLLQPGEYIYSADRRQCIGSCPDVVKFYIKTYKETLIFTGRAGSIVGVSVPGADGCTFNPTATYKDGKLVDYDVSATSYTVKSGATGCLLTFVPGDRHICGNVEEQCSIDNDCGGHTYGRYECYGRTLQEYGCRTFSKPYYLEQYGGGYAFKPFEIDNEETQVNTLGPLSRCEIISASSVSCCGDTDCGTNAFCDVGNTWTCKSTAQCQVNSDCGVSVQCDINLKQLKKPACVLGKCTYQKIQDVDCCTSQDCAVGYFCDTDYTCKESTVPKIACPFECCVNEEKYFDRPCPSNKPYCVNNVCKTEFEPSEDCESCDEYALSRILPIEKFACKPKTFQTTITCVGSFLKILSIIPLFIISLLFGKDILTSFKALKNKDWLAWIFAVILAFFVAYIYFILFWIGVIILIGIIIFKFIRKKFVV